MRISSAHRSLLTWLVLFCILSSSFACALGHGQMTGLELQLGSLDGQFCSLGGHSPSGPSTNDERRMPLQASLASGCVMASTFGALLLAVFFGLFARLAQGSRPLAPRDPLTRAVRYCWPPANPRASPFQA